MSAATDRLRRSTDAAQVVRDCHASVDAGRTALERAEQVLRRASLQVHRNDLALASMRRFLGVGPVIRPGATGRT